MSGNRVRAVFFDFDTGAVQRYKDIPTPYVMQFSPEIPFNTAFTRDSRHFAMIGIGRSIAGYSTGLGGWYGYIMETTDS